MDFLLMLQAFMKLNETNQERKLIIQKLISELSLEKQKYTRIKYLSGGEKRRLSLASEVNPLKTLSNSFWI